MKRILLVPLAIALAACGGGDDDTATDDSPATADDGTADDGTGEGEADPVDGTDDAATETTAAAAPELPAECQEAPFELDVSMPEVPELDGPFTVEGVAGQATPIVPNGDGSLDDLDPSEFTELGAETDLLVHAQYVGNHPFGQDDLGILGPPDPPAGAVTLVLSVVPPTADGLATGDVVSSDDELQYDSITTFGTVGVFLQGPEDYETFLVVDNLDEAQGGTAEVLYVDEDWLCVDWSLAGETVDPDGTYSIEGVVLTQLDRKETPFT